MRLFRVVVVAGLCSAVGPAWVMAQTPSVRAYLTPGETIGVGQQFVLNVEMSGTQSLDRSPQPPDITSFAHFLGSSSQSTSRIVNGRSTVSLTSQYRYQALIEGSFQIPSIEVEAAGGTHVTTPLNVTITAALGEAGPAGNGIVRDDLFITVEASQRSVRDGEPLVVEYRIWTRVDVTNFGMTRVPELEGFWVEDATPPGQAVVEQLTRDGVDYASAVIRRVVLVPTGPGERLIEPIGVEAQVRVRGGRDPFQDIFGRSSLFGSTTVPATVLSNPLSIDVEPLPPGRPNPFSGVVGRLDITSELDRDSVNMNDAVTLTVRVTGEGNIRAIPAPVLNLPPDFEVFPPEVSESVRVTGTGLSGNKTFAYVLIPRAPGVREIPSVPVSFFDRATDEYRTEESEPLPLVVTGTVLEGPIALARGGVAQLREDIRFIHLGPLSLRTTRRPLLTSMAVWLFGLLPLVAIIGAIGLRRHQDLLEGDVAYARGLRAGRLARKRLAEASRLAAGEDARAFYAEVARALRGFVSDRLNLPEAGLQITDIDSALERDGVGEEIRAGVRGCLETCDRQRFAPPDVDSGERTRLLAQASELMTALVRSVKS